MNLRTLALEAGISLETRGQQSSHVIRHLPTWIGMVAQHITSLPFLTVKLSCAAWHFAFCWLCTFLQGTGSQLQRPCQWQKRSWVQELEGGQIGSSCAQLQGSKAQQILSWGGKQIWWHLQGMGRVWQLPIKQHSCWLYAIVDSVPSNIVCVKSVYDETFNVFCCCP